jgi:hypothetical protein
MIWYLTSDQVLVDHRNSKTTKKDDDNNRDNKTEDNSSKPSQILCSICKRSDKIVTDPESGDFRAQLNSPSDRNLTTAFKLLDTLKDKLRLSDAIVEKVAYIYRKVQERGFIRGRSIPAVITAALYISYRELGISKTMKDISVASNLKRKNIARTYRQLILELDY